MPTLNRSDAQQRADDIGVFNRELARLEAEQVLQLSEPQRASLHRHQQQLLQGYLAAGVGGQCVLSLLSVLGAVR